MAVTAQKDLEKSGEGKRVWIVPTAIRYFYQQDVTAKLEEAMSGLEERMKLLKPTLDYADLKNADIVIEAVFEDMDVKRKVFQTLDQTMKKGAILASNTSTLDLDKIASFTKRPADVIGTHFFSPANVMRLLEVVRGKKTGKDVLATVMQLAKSLEYKGAATAVRQ